MNSSYNHPCILILVHATLHSSNLRDAAARFSASQSYKNIYLIITLFCSFESIVVPFNLAIGALPFGWNGFGHPRFTVQIE